MDRQDNLPDMVAMFKALGDPTRLRIFEFLRSCAGEVAVEETGEVRPVSGPTVGEVCCKITGAEQINSKVSHHLKELRLAGLITVERRGKNMICGVNPKALEKLRAYFSSNKEDCSKCGTQDAENHMVREKIHPGYETQGRNMKRVMFVCKKNSRRSQMAEGFARTLGEGVIEVASSGLEASHVDPKATEVMAEVGIDISNQTSKPLSDFKPEDYDAVISLCGCGVNLPEVWVLRDVFQDWQLDDPEGQPIETFHRVRDEIKERVASLLTEVRSTSKP